MVPVRFRPAWLTDGEMLTGLAMRSKAHWGYDAAFMEACRAELTVTEEIIRKNSYIVADNGPQTAALGMYGLHGNGACLEVENFFIDPPHIGTGLGRRMMDHCKKVARAHNAKELSLDADPNAEGFYAAMGFETISHVPSGSIPDRTLLHMRLRLV